MKGNAAIWVGTEVDGRGEEQTVGIMESTSLGHGEEELWNMWKRVACGWMALVVNVQRWKGKTWMEVDRGG